jgi:hypothetical protein
MELEVTLRIPAAGSTLTIPTRQRVFDDAGSRVLDSVHVADVGSLQSVEFADGQLRIELRTGEAYQFPIGELLTGGKDATLKVEEPVPGGAAAFGGLEQKTRLHEVQLAHLHSLQLVEPEATSAPERWERQPATVAQGSSTAGVPGP